MTDKVKEEKSCDLPKETQRCLTLIGNVFFIGNMLILPLLLLITKKPEIVGYVFCGSIGFFIFSTVYIVVDSVFGGEK